MTAYVVLGMHGSGTSLVAQMLHQMGVNMHPNLNARVLDYQTFEDGGFMRLNDQLLRCAGGDWKDPPPSERILACAQRPDWPERTGALIEGRAKGNARWGWKDPRNCLTVEAYRPFLQGHDPHLIHVVRDAQGMAASMLRRGGSSDAQRWIELGRRYRQAADAALKTFGAPVLVLRYEQLVNRTTAPEVLKDLAIFLGIGSWRRGVRNGMSVIRFRG
jgi:hypothetical protein